MEVSEKEENSESGFICFIKQQADEKWTAQLSLVVVGQNGDQDIFHYQQMLFISYMEIKLFSIAVAMQKNKWVKQWDVAEIVIAIRLSGLQMALAFVLFGCTMCADVHVELRQQCNERITGEQLYGCFDKLILQGSAPCKCAIGWLIALPLKRQEVLYILKSNDFSLCHCHFFNSNFF